ncbi:hypothetical protein RJ55_08487 [Drechmeria coniospora]|nr:hypothetical protein RJ55_08487 [Drechmeria coniospora]
MVDGPRWSDSQPTARPANDPSGVLSWLALLAGLVPKSRLAAPAHDPLMDLATSDAARRLPVSFAMDLLLPDITAALNDPPLLGDASGQAGSFTPLVSFAVGLALHQLTLLRVPTLQDGVMRRATWNHCILFVSLTKALLAIK